MADARMTLDDLRRVLLEAAGADEGMDLGGDITDTPFDDLGYDSLALMEAGSRLQREFGVSLSDESLAEATTPRALIDLVNDRLAAGASA
ncbi:acyl carrier protein [Streptomyces hainanensis]|uniref:Acyl carrier protein n=1 Tax=Streptomyces hainanensis TaxID=402648 RepID=A0A4R4TGW3_9ACTN|nr:acyl carrier protein [Streptomyces hainanensis]TDC74462.1 acyl carrier protein [Streptomyces hainanensis]